MADNQRIIIIGGGLSGLTVAYLLSKRNMKSTILEASSRLGGRIQTIKGIQETPLELGATWFSDAHSNLLALINALGLISYPQFSGGISLFQTKSFEPPQKFFVPEAENPSYRLVGGTQVLIDTLAAQLPTETIHYNNKVTLLSQSEKGILLETSNGMRYEADKVILCVPPQLIAKSMTFSPELPESVNEILPTVQTWMAGSIKFTLEYDEPFWRTHGYSGMLYSHAGIIMEMYDHTNYEENKFGFTGFLNSGAAAYSSEVRKEIVINQLNDLLGPQASKYVAYFDKIWADEFILAGNQIIQRPHQNNGHPLLQQSFMNDRLFFSVTESAIQYSGYMEGAVIAAHSLVEKFCKIS